MAAHPPTMVLGGWVGWLLTHSFGVSILPRAFVGLWLFATTKAEKEERKSMDCMRGEELCKRGNNNNNNGSRPQTEAFLSLSSFHSIQPSLFFWQIDIQKEQNRSDYESISGKPQPWHLFFKSFHRTKAPFHLPAVSNIDTRRRHIVYLFHFPGCYEKMSQK